MICFLDKFSIELNSNFLIQHRPREHSVYFIPTNARYLKFIVGQQQHKKHDGSDLKDDNDDDDDVFVSSDEDEEDNEVETTEESE